MQDHMRKTLIVTSHPHKESLTVRAATYAHNSLEKNKHRSTFIHLDSHDYSPIMPQEEIMRNFSFDTSTQAFKKQVLESTQIALFYPDWWGMPPALLVGWMQRVLSLGVAFELQEHRNGEFEMLPRLNHIRMLYAISSDTQNTERLQKIAQATQDRLAHFAGIRSTHICILHNTRKQTYKKRTQWIEICAQLLTEKAWNTDSTIL